MAAANIIDISEETFEFEVINYSAEVPVVLDLWAPWCIPCRVQSRDLAQLAHEADGGFRLARVNVDDQPKLAARLKVQQVPAIKAYVDGRIVAEVTGVLNEQNLRLFVDLSELDDAKPAKALPVRAVLPNGIALVRTEPSTVEIHSKE